MINSCKTCNILQLFLSHMRLTGQLMLNCMHDIVLKALKSSINIADTTAAVGVTLSEVTGSIVGVTETGGSVTIGHTTGGDCVYMGMCF